GRGRLKNTLANVGTLARHHAAYGMLPHPELNVMNEQALRLPYGVAIATGCWIALLGTWVR
ncbi:MAG: A24 family peptidase, partial [Terriglobales bacterium]